MDDLDKYAAGREGREPGFDQLVIDAEKRQAFARQLAEQRRSSGKTQTQVAALMHTSASIVSRLEGGADVRISTLEKYAAAIGCELDIRARSRAHRSTAAARKSAAGPAARKRRKGSSRTPRQKTG